jgi:hypothetical protein
LAPQRKNDKKIKEESVELEKVFGICVANERVVANFLLWSLCIGEKVVVRAIG